MSLSYYFFLYKTLSNSRPYSSSPFILSPVFFLTLYPLSRILPHPLSFPISDEILFIVFFLIWCPILKSNVLLSFSHWTTSIKLEISSLHLDYLVLNGRGNVIKNTFPVLFARQKMFRLHRNSSNRCPEQLQNFSSEATVNESISTLMRFNDSENQKLHYHF